MAKKVKIIAALSVLLVLCSLFFGCRKDTLPDYSKIELDEYIELGEYKAMTLDMTEETASADIVLWNKIVDNAKVLKYPEKELKYYLDKTQKKYDMLADEGGMKLSELLSSLGITNEDIEDEAKDLVKRDLVQAAIIERENIELTDEEKEKFFDRYAEKYTEIYGYSKEYVRDNLTDEIYSSMLYDKMMEYLMINNDLVK